MLFATRRDEPAGPRHEGCGGRSRSGSDWRILLLAVASCVSFTIALPCHACPKCSVGITAREQVLQENFLPHLTVALAPFLIVALVCLWVERARFARAPSLRENENESYR